MGLGIVAALGGASARAGDEEGLEHSLFSCGRTGSVNSASACANSRGLNPAAQEAKNPHGLTLDASRKGEQSASGKAIAALIRDLGDSSYETRTSATRRLCAIGMRAAKMLKKAARGDDIEIALRAKAVLDLLEGLMFAGVEVRLAFSETRVAWDEPVDLTITMTNRSDYPARVPFELNDVDRNAVTGDARQVGDMLDVAELIALRRGDGRPIELTVDDIAADPAVLAAVERRLDGGPLSLLEPEQRVAITARVFNRGWARYALLEAGVYTAQLEYVPRWHDGILAKQQVGRVVSNQATITVTNGAPEAVSRGGTEASLTVQRAGPFIVAMVTNRTDQPLIINKNFGRAAPFAQGHWVYELDGTHREMPVKGKPAASWHEFDAALLVTVQPGDTLEMARRRIDELRRALIEAGSSIDNSRWTLHFSYSNLCGRQWQARQGSALIGNPKAPTIFQTKLPRRILSARHTSNHLSAPTTD